MEQLSQDATSDGLPMALAPNSDRTRSGRPALAATTQPTPADLADDPPEVSIRLVWCAAMYVQDRFGPDVLEERCAREQKKWISLRQMNVFYDAVRELVGDDAGMQEAFVHGLQDAYGPPEVDRPSRSEL